MKRMGNEMDFDKTMSFNFEKEKNEKIKETLKEVYEALVEKGYNPISYINIVFIYRKKYC